MSQTKNYSSSSSLSILRRTALKPYSKPLLGATIYCPLIRPNLLEDIRKMQKKGASSVVICLEDAIPDERVEEGEQNVQNLLQQLGSLTDAEKESLPLLFLRPRNPSHLWNIFRQNGDNLRHLTGFRFP